MCDEHRPIAVRARRRAGRDRVRPPGRVGGDRGSARSAAARGTARGRVCGVDRPGERPVDSAAAFIGAATGQDRRSEICGDEEAMSTAQQIGLALATVACAFDLRTRRIPQMVTLGGAAAGLVFQTVNAGWAGGAVSVTGWLVGTAVFLVPF